MPPAELTRALAIAVALAPAGARADDAPPPQLELTEADLIALAEAEAIEIWDTRPERPMERDTRARLTEVDLLPLGLGDLGDALALVPEIAVRDAGRGGQVIDVRGARKGALRLLVDGVPLEDPYYGTFDVTTIPLTDVVEVRVATSPASPLDGPGGPGGVVEVHTRDAVGTPRAAARLGADSLPTAAASASGRAATPGGLGLRLSATGEVGDHAYAVPGGTLRDERRGSAGAMRVEWRPAGQAARRVVVDVAGLRRGYVVPPTEDDVATVTDIERDAGLRAAVTAEDRRGRVALVARAFGAMSWRVSRGYADASLTEPRSLEDLAAQRGGAALLASRPIGADLRLLAAAHVVAEHARAEDAAGRATIGRAAVSELAVGAQASRGGWAGRLDAGVALPLGVGEAPWPEAKLVVTRALPAGLELRLTGARKGRLPTLRERYQDRVGNVALDPELTSFVEVAAERATGVVTFEAAGWARRQAGLIRADPDTAALVNLGVIDFAGADLRVTGRVHARATLVGAWSYVVADDGSAEVPLDNLPRHRATGEVRLAPVRDLRASLRASYTTSRVDRGLTLDGYAEVAATITWAPRAGWLVALRGDDLLDRRWLVHEGQPSVGRTLAITVQTSTD